MNLTRLEVWEGGVVSGVRQYLLGWGHHGVWYWPMDRTDSFEDTFLGSSGVPCWVPLFWSCLTRV